MLDTQGSGTVTLVDLKKALLQVHSERLMDDETIEKLFHGIDGKPILSMYSYNSSSEHLKCVYTHLIADVLLYARASYSRCLIFLIYHLSSFSTDDLLQSIVAGRFIGTSF